MSEKNYFAELAQIDVGEHIERKGKFSYLSWAWAVQTLRTHDPSATWEVMRFDGMPYMKTDCGYFVEVACTVNGITLSQIHPVLNNQNKPIPQPNAFEINTSIQRCLVKAIALHGLGLYIYAGEDLPVDNTPPAPITPEQVGQIKLKVGTLMQMRKVKKEAVYTKLNTTENNLTNATAEQADGMMKSLDVWIKNAQKEIQKQTAGA